LNAPDSINRKFLNLLILRLTSETRSLNMSPLTSVSVSTL
jgi:hypothetical protein